MDINMAQSQCTAKNLLM